MTNNFGGSEPRYYSAVDQIEETMDPTRATAKLREAGWELLTIKERSISTRAADGKSIIQTIEPVYIFGHIRGVKKDTLPPGITPPEEEKTPAQQSTKAESIEDRITALANWKPSQFEDKEWKQKPDYLFPEAIPKDIQEFFKAVPEHRANIGSYSYVMTPKGYLQRYKVEST